MEVEGPMSFGNSHISFLSIFKPFFIPDCTDETMCNKISTLFHVSALKIKTLPKAQQTRGLSSYHKITVDSLQILNKLQFQNLDSTS